MVEVATAVPETSYHMFSGVPDRMITFFGADSKVSVWPLQSVTVIGNESDETPGVSRGAVISAEGSTLADGVAAGSLLQPAKARHPRRNVSDTRNRCESERIR